MDPTVEHVAPIADVVELVDGAPFEAERPERQASQWTGTRLGVDAAMLFAAALAAQLGANAARVATTPPVWLLAFSLLVVGISHARGAYAWRIRLQAIDDFWSVLMTTALAGMILLSARVIVAHDASVGGQTLRLWAFAAVYVGTGRIAVDWSQIKARREGELAK